MTTTAQALRQAGTDINAEAEKLRISNRTKPYFVVLAAIAAALITMATAFEEDGNSND